MATVGEILRMLIAGVDETRYIDNEGRIVEVRINGRRSIPRLPDDIASYFNRSGGKASELIRNYTAHVNGREAKVSITARYGNQPESVLVNIEFIEFEGGHLRWNDKGVEAYANMLAKGISSKLNGHMGYESVTVTIKYGNMTKVGEYRRKEKGSYWHIPV